MFWSIGIRRTQRFILKTFIVEKASGKPDEGRDSSPQRPQAIVRGDVAQAGARARRQTSDKPEPEPEPEPPTRNLVMQMQVDA